MHVSVLASCTSNTHAANFKAFRLRDNCLISIGELCGKIFTGLPLQMCIWPEASRYRIYPLRFVLAAISLTPSGLRGTFSIGLCLGFWCMSYCYPCALSASITHQATEGHQLGLPPKILKLQRFRKPWESQCISAIVSLQSQLRCSYHSGLLNPGCLHG